jgi:pSer/pThr/pTyr-binding forkhead associated (FHA) protein
MIATAVLTLRIVMAIALYSFLGWTLLTLWRELKQQADQLAAQKTPGITIDDRLGLGRQNQNRFTQTEIVIGRDKNCDISVADEAVSAHHARVTFHHGQWWLEDLGSTNGTFLNREKLNIPAVLITGDEFKCGDTLFNIRIDIDNKLSPTSKLQTGGPS